MYRVLQQHKPRALAVAASLLILVSLTALITIFSDHPALGPERMSVREIRLAAPPPPPPPPPPAQTRLNLELSPRLSLATSGTGAVIEVGKLQLGDPVDVARLAPPQKSLDFSDLQDDLNVALSDIFEIAELDERPRLLTSLDVRYPSSLKRRGIRTTRAKVEVVIDTDGQVILKRIMHSSHAEMNPIIADIIKRARFTAPRKDGVPVRASFNWPLEFRDA